LSICQALDLLLIISKSLGLKIVSNLIHIPRERKARTGNWGNNNGKSSFLIIVATHFDFLPSYNSDGTLTLEKIESINRLRYRKRRAIGHSNSQKRVYLEMLKAFRYVIYLQTKEKNIKLRVHHRHENEIAC
jgi:hypothetical protein